MSIKVSYIDFWQEYKGIPEKIEDINNIKYWMNLTISRELKTVDEGIGLFNKRSNSKIQRWWFLYY
jgi:hypothetical protein